MPIYFGKAVKQLANLTAPIVLNGLKVTHRVLEQVGCDLEGSDDLQKGFILCRNIMLNALEKVMTEGEQIEQVNHPAHYNRPGRKECIEEMIDKFGARDTAKWCEMTAFKYDYRAGEKEGNPEEQDKAKEEWYLNRAEAIRLTYDIDEDSNADRCVMCGKYVVEGRRVCHRCESAIDDDMK